MTTVINVVRSGRRTLWLWNWRRHTRNQPQPPLNAWGCPDVGYW